MIERILPISDRGSLCFSSRLTAIASSFTLTAGYSFNTSHRSSFDRQNKSEYPTLFTLAVRLLPEAPLLYYITRIINLFH